MIGQRLYRIAAAVCAGAVILLGGIMPERISPASDQVPPLHAGTPVSSVASLIAGGAAPATEAAAKPAAPGSEYHISYRPERNVYQSRNRSQRMQVSYGSNGFFSQTEHASPQEYDFSLCLEGISKGEEIFRPTQVADLSASSRVCVAGERMTVRHDQFSIEYKNDAEGMRQNFIVQRPPAGDEHLQVRLRPEEGVWPMIAGEDDALFMRGRGEGAERVVWYRGLAVWDAAGRELPAHMENSGDDLLLVVDDRGAQYPVTVDPLLSDADWSITATSSIANAGDVNNDGFDDVIVGGGGQARVFLGSASGLATAPAWTVTANPPNSSFASNVASAGDVNSDGYDDVLVAGPGRVYAYYGSAGGLATTPAWYATDDTGRAVSGESMGCAGDVNGDGYDDVILGSTSYSGLNYRGRVFVYHGSASGLPARASWSDGQGREYGCSVSGAGDVNGDGYDDIIIGGYLYRGTTRIDEGAAYIFHGSASGLSRTFDWRVKGNYSNAWFGYSVSGGGDENGDGFSDVVVGLPWEYGHSSSYDYGCAYFFYGRASGVPLVPNGIYSEGGEWRERYGTALAFVGDLNGDGYDEFASGSPGYNRPGSGAGTGRVDVYFGSATGQRAPDSWTITKDASSVGLGSNVGPAGDVNGDGYDELIVREQGGRAFIFYGGPSAPQRTLSGSVLDDNGNPIAGVAVKLDNITGSTVTTNAQGRFALVPVTPGAHTLTVSKSGYQTATFDLTMPDADKYVVLGLSPASVPPPSGPYTVCGTVTSADGSGARLADVAVEVLQNGSVVHTTSTDGQGAFCSAALAAGTYQVRFSKNGYETLTADLVLNANKQIVISLVPSQLQ